MQIYYDAVQDTIKVKKRKLIVDKGVRDANNIDIVKLLLDKVKISDYALQDAIKANKIDIIKLLLKHGIQIANGYFLYNIELNNLEVENGVNINADSLSYNYIQEQKEQIQEQKEEEEQIQEQKKEEEQIQEQKKEEEQIQEQKKEEEEQKVICPICLSTDTEKYVINCGHVFCGECINIINNKYSTCPTCRKHIDIHYTRRIYI